MEKKDIPHELREITFYDEKLSVALIDNNAFVALRPIVGYLGLDWSAQRQRLLRDEVLSYHTITVPLLHGRYKQRYGMLCLQLEYFPGWLFGIVPSRIKPELAPKLRRYREECFHILWYTFQEELLQILPEQQNDQNTYFWLAGVEQRVRRALIRAERAGLPATLTVEQWLQTLELFHFRCAYCQEKPGLIIEHFIPIPSGGTTIGNCVPSCYACNSKKGSSHPNAITAISRDVLDSICSQLGNLTVNVLNVERSNHCQNGNGY